MPYQLEHKRTVDSTWIVDSATLTAAQFPVTISGLTAGTQYDVRCLARDASGNVSAYSTVSQASTSGTIVWSAVPTITFTQGTLATRDISQYDSSGATDIITHTAGTLPTGVTYNQSLKRYEYDGAGAIAGTNGHILTADNSGDDWASRGTVGVNGVVMADRLNSGNVTTWAFSQPGNISLDTVRKPTGSTGSAKFAILDSDGAGSGQMSIPFPQTFGNGQTFWISYRVYLTPEDAYRAYSSGTGAIDTSGGFASTTTQFETTIKGPNNGQQDPGYIGSTLKWLTGSLTGTKVAITNYIDGSFIDASTRRGRWTVATMAGVPANGDQFVVLGVTTSPKWGILSRYGNGPAPTSSNQPNEIVLGSGEGEVGGYHQDGSGSPGFEVADNNSCSSSDFILNQATINRGITLSGTNPNSGSAWSTCENYRANHGLLYSQRSGADYQPGYGDPFSGGVRPYPNEWLTVTKRIIIGSFGSANNQITVWIAREGQSYTKLIDQTVLLGGSSPNYNGFNPLPYCTSRTPGGVKVSARTSNITGCTIQATGPYNTLGDGVLEYTASTQRFRYHANGEAFGVVRGFSAANGFLTLNVGGATQFNSKPENFLCITVNPALLPTSGVVTDTVTIAAGRGDSQRNYADFILSTGAINAPGGFAPT